MGRVRGESLKPNGTLWGYFNDAGALGLQHKIIHKSSIRRWPFITTIIKMQNEAHRLKPKNNQPE